MNKWLIPFLKRLNSNVLTIPRPGIYTTIAYRTHIHYPWRTDCPPFAGSIYMPAPFGQKYRQKPQYLVVDSRDQDFPLVVHP